MRIHHLNCATMRPPMAPPMVAHVLLVERADGLTLVDSGFGTADVADPARRLGRPFVLTTRAAMDPAETALAQVRALGFEGDDVTDVVLTHLDLDHAGGIGDFPRARVHVHASELAAARRPSLREKARYVQAQWAHGPQWVEHREDGDDFLGLAGAKVVGSGSDAGDVVLVPMHGHTRGHSAVAVRADDDRWLLHAGDAFFAAGQIDAPPTCPRTLAAFQRLLAVDEGARVANLRRLQTIAAEHPEVTVFCAHDRSQFEALAGA